MPNFLHRRIVESRLTLHHLQHPAVEIAKIVIAKGLVIDQIPLPARILVAPSVALAREIDPLGMTKLVAHKIEVASVDSS